MSWGDIVGYLDDARDEILDAEMFVAIAIEMMDRRDTADRRVFDMKHVDRLSALVAGRLASISERISAAYVHATEQEVRHLATIAPDRA